MPEDWPGRDLVECQEMQEEPLRGGRWGQGHVCVRGAVVVHFQACNIGNGDTEKVVIHSRPFVCGGARERKRYRARCRCSSREMRESVELVVEVV